MAMGGGGGDDNEGDGDKRGEFGWSSSSSTVSQEERQEEEKNKVEVSAVSWQPVVGSLWWRGKQRVGGRVIEVIRPRMVELGHPEAGRRMARMGAIRKIKTAGSG